MTTTVSRLYLAVITLMASVGVMEVALQLEDGARFICASLGVFMLWGIAVFEMAIWLYHLGHLIAARFSKKAKP